MTGERALRVLRERWGIAVLCLLLGLLGAGIATYATPREYSADVTLYVSLQGRADDSDEAYQASQLAEERVVSYAPLLTDERITRPVIDDLGLGVTPDQLAERITVEVEPETVVLSAAVRDASPAGAAAIANALADQFVGLVQELEPPIGPAAPPPAPGEPAPDPARIGAQIIRPAVPQPAPVAPDVPFNLALGAALGLLIGAVAAVVRDARDTSVRSAARLQELTSAPVLAEFAHDRQVPTRPLIVDDPPGSARAEAFRSLRNTLQFLDRRHDHRVFVVTSVHVGGGSSTTACNLAVALAEAGNRVLLVDANLRSPRVGDYTGLDPGPGLIDVLVGRIAWPYAKQRWHRGAFDVLPAGSTSHHPSQLLASYGMGDLLEELRRHYDFVVVDAPALLAVSDAPAVAARSDGVVLVVPYRRASEEHVVESVAALEAVSARLLGTVLTMTRRRRRRRARVPSYPQPGRGTAAPSSWADRAVRTAAVPAPRSGTPDDGLPAEGVPGDRMPDDRLPDDRPTDDRLNDDGGPPDDAREAAAPAPVRDGTWRPSPTPRR